MLSALTPLFQARQPSIAARERIALDPHALQHADKEIAQGSIVVPSEDEVLAVLEAQQPDYIVLAKFMRILSPDFIARYEQRILNIHHSFLPAFVGAQPYRQAFERGVKLIGATAHIVTNNLDEGPIIAQQTIPVNHTFGVKEMIKAGKEIEKAVLNKAMQLLFEDRVFLNENKTIVFE